MEQRPNDREPKSLAELTPEFMQELLQRTNLSDLDKARLGAVNLKHHPHATDEERQAVYDEVVRLENEARENPRPGE